jgi:3-oxoadipate enol-lactonase
LPYFESQEGKVFYRLFGKGELTLVFVHGAMGSHRLWEKQVPFFSKRYSLLLIDVRGHGNSSKPRSGYQMERMVEDLHMLMDYLRIEDAVFIGSSMGGVIVQKFACKYPSRVKALVLVGTLAKAIWLGKAQEYAKRVASEDYKIGVRSWFTPNSEANDEEFALNEASRVSRYFRSGVILDNPDWDIRKQISNITAPTIIIVGKDDVNTTPVEESKIIHRLIKSSEIRIVPKVGHLVMLEDRENFNQILSSFLAKNGM